MFNNKFLLLQILRSLFAGVLVSFICHTADIGTPSPHLIVAMLLGIIAAGYWVKQQNNLKRCLVIHSVALIATIAIFKIADPLVSVIAGGTDSSDFLVTRLWHHVSLIGFCYFVGFIGSWLFWSWRHTVTAEIIAIASAFVWLTSGHQNYHLDAPKKLSELAWEMNLSPQVFLLSLGTLFAIAIGAYLALSSTRPLFGKNPNPVTTLGKRQKFLSFSIPILLLCLIGLLAVFINQRYSQNLSRATNGVGQEDKEGQSPLGFHSAIGQTKQPAALVRLDTDYADNPWSPMLYLREGALSEYNGKELVIASSAFDTDVPRILPGQPFSRKDWSTGGGRKQISQSVFLLTDHKAPFALDFPLSMRQIRNPDPQRFKLAYQALSAAPIAQAPQLFGENVGSHSWSKAEWEHYTRAPGSLSDSEPDAQVLQNSDPVVDKNGEDLRYRAMAHSITGEATTPVEKAIAISHYLSQTSVYTRNPGHNVTERGDPVAPYLFAEKKRGYCVHFAHAAVYLMRLLGIPARIGTGYLTDLRYAKDGHILLHLGDRHAWPEIYVEGQGWVVVDIQPAEAENEQELIPDEKLLEELMSKIDPAEEFVPPPPPEENKPNNITEKVLAHALSARSLASLTVIAILLYLFAKTWLRFSYRLAREPRAKVRRAYLSYASTMCDAGLGRQAGETRREYERRLNAEVQIEGNLITSAHEQIVYAGNLAVVKELDADHSSLSWQKSFHLRFPVWKRLLMFLNPTSILRRNEL